MQSLSEQGLGPDREVPRAVATNRTGGAASDKEAEDAAAAASAVLTQDR
jgi:hypothetical protein